MAYNINIYHLIRILGQNDRNYLIKALFFCEPKNFITLNLYVLLLYFIKKFVFQNLLTFLYTYKIMTMARNIMDLLYNFYRKTCSDF